MDYCTNETASFNSTVNIEEFMTDDEIAVTENETVATIPPITKGSTNDLTNEMKVAIYREEKNDLNKLPGKYHLKQVGDVLMNTRLLAISENGSICTGNTNGTFTDVRFLTSTSNFA